MAIGRIEVLRGLPPEDPRGRVEAVHRSLVSALRVPSDDPTVLLVELDPEHAMLPAGATTQFTVVQVTLFAGRSPAVKQELYRLLYQSLHSLGVAPSDVLVVLVESSRSNWAAGGEVPASEVDLGFSVEI